jgi:hypothetical protein
VDEREFIDDLSSGSMPDVYTAVGGERGAADLQQVDHLRDFAAVSVYSTVTNDIWWMDELF